MGPFYRPNKRPGRLPLGLGCLGALESSAFFEQPPFDQLSAAQVVLVDPASEQSAVEFVGGCVRVLALSGLQIRAVL